MSRKLILLLAVLVAVRAIDLVPAFAQSTSDACRKTDMSDRSIQACDQSIRQSPTEASLYLWRGYHKTRQGDLDGALSDAKTAIKLDPKDGGGLNLAASISLSLNYVEEAIADLEKAKTLGLSIAGPYTASDMYAQLGKAWCSSGRSEKKPEYQEKGTNYYGEAIKLRPLEPVLFYGRGECLNDAGHLEAAIFDFSEAIRLKAKFSEANVLYSYNIIFDAYVQRGALKSKKLDYSGAISDFNEAIQIEPRSPRTARPLLYRARVYEAKGDFDKALAEYRDYDSRLPGNSASPPAIARLEAAIIESKQSPSSATSVNTRRIALVIGNSKYKNAPLLPNPERDAAMVADALKRTGFAEVTLQTDLGKEALSTALQKFSVSAESADWAVVYFAGHGMEIGGINYLIPIDATLERDKDVEFQAIPLNQVLTVVSGAHGLRLVVLDACRTNPFANSMKRQLANRTVERGFARTDPNPGTLVVYAAKDGEVASDGTGSNSPFSIAFVSNIQKPGVEIGRLFRLVGDDVRRATGGTQTPYTYGALSGRDEFYFVDRK